MELHHTTCTMPVGKQVMWNTFYMYTLQNGFLVKLVHTGDFQSQVYTSLVYITSVIAHILRPRSIEHFQLKDI